MAKQRVFLTGATGTMGSCGMKELLKDTDDLDLVILARPSEKNRKMLAPYEGADGLEIVWGDLTDYDEAEACVRNADIVLHVAAFVSPEADYHPESAMAINYGSTVHIVNAIRELGQEQQTRLVYIGTVAETGDRMPPIHWGRIGDPLKPSVYDYYAVSKIASERYVIESELPYWTSLRQTGIIGPAMCAIEDAIMFHNCLDNVLEYASDRDSATMLRNLCRKEREGQLDNKLWGHIFNIGGGEGCRVSCYNMFSDLFRELGLTHLEYALDSKWFATRNFHGHYFLDSDKLNDILEFRSDTMQYFYDAYLEMLGGTAGLSRFMTKLPGGQKLVGGNMKKRFQKLVNARHGTEHFITEDMEGHIAAYWGSREAWEAIPPLEEFQHFADWDTVVHIDHGYDESKPDEALSLADVQGAAKFRGGDCLSTEMETGDWTTKLQFRCGFGHNFEASPRLVLEGGHWCPECERKSWNYYARARIDPFFAQIWYPLHDKDETEREYPKEVSELDVVL